jgi:hypothetical protein
MAHNLQVIYLQIAYQQLTNSILYVLLVIQQGDLRQAIYYLMRLLSLENQLSCFRTKSFVIVYLFFFKMKCRSFIHIFSFYPRKFIVVLYLCVQHVVIIM